MNTLSYYRKKHILPQEPIRVQTKKKIDSLEKCQGFMVKETNLITRRENTLGTYRGWVSGCGGDVWWIQHDDDSVAAYGFWELKEPEKK